MDISVIICAYTEERWDELVAAVASVRAQSKPAYELILVIDHNPRLLERARAAFPDLLILGNQETRGLSGARNTGLAAVQGEIVAFMDEDACAQPDWLERLASGYADERVIGVGGAIRPLWQSPRPAWFPEEFEWVVGCTYRGMSRLTAPVRNLIGANMSFRSLIFQKTGGFRTEMGRIGTLPVGCEETEFCIRSAQRLPGSLYLYEPQALVHHRVPAQRTSWRYFLRRCFSEGISKAQVTRRVGVQNGLSNERNYTLRVLPSGFVRGIADSVRHKNFHGLARALAIAAGLLTTSVGYFYGSLTEKLAVLRNINRSVREAAVGGGK